MEVFRSEVSLFRYNPFAFEVCQNEFFQREVVVLEKATGGKRGGSGNAKPACILRADLVLKKQEQAHGCGQGKYAAQKLTHTQAKCYTFFVGRYVFWDFDFDKWSRPFNRHELNSLCLFVTMKETMERGM